MFREKIPIVVRNHLADMTFDSTTCEAIFDKADQVWDSNRSSEPAQVAATSAVPSSTTEVAAVQGQKVKIKIEDAVKEIKIVVKIEVKVGKVVKIKTKTQVVKMVSQNQTKPS